MSDSSKHNQTIIVRSVSTNRAYFMLTPATFQIFCFVLFSVYLAPLEFSRSLFTQTAPCVDLSYTGVARHDEWVGVSFFEVSRPHDNSRRLGTWIRVAVLNSCDHRSFTAISIHFVFHIWCILLDQIIPCSTSWGISYNIPCTTSFDDFSVTPALAFLQF